ncbi:MAG: hypothetical protein KF744_09380 [Taibaiella sp.]|nr:hypothetical protein [Taibaiella sp.]
MFSSQKIKYITAIALSGMIVGTASAQKTCKNLSPCADCAVHDNNGNDLAGFVKAYRKQLGINGAKVNDISNGEWGYLLMRTANVPSVSTKWETKGDLNHSAYIRTALVMNKTKDKELATWWARECNLDNGAVVEPLPKEKNTVSMEQMRHERLMDAVSVKKITLVEYLDTFNMRDMDNMLKSHIVTKLGTIKQEDYKSVIDFYNGFLGKFSYIDDPVLTKMSFVTFLTGASGTRYMGYFNVRNSKLSGSLSAVNLEYERDRDTLVKKTFKNLDTKTVYIYGDDSFGLDKTLIKYAKNNDMKLRRRKTNVSARFNDER